MNPKRFAALIPAVLLSACLAGEEPVQTVAPAIAAPASPAPTAPARPVTSEGLIGQGEGDILALFGPPGLKRRESGAEFWQYADTGCIMDFYFYGDAGARKVSYVTLRDPATGRVGGTACQGKLAKAAAR
ncbi:MAG: hypothetical protein OEL53_07405 [Rhodospirillales bacterium]|nr:hypothetical protein [Rhodospirillales bacterium]